MKKKEGLLITSSLLDSYAYLQETKNKISAYSDFILSFGITRGLYE